ncbi:MAG: c-type cytochrome [Planctomycetota bacterium]
MRRLRPLFVTATLAGTLLLASLGCEPAIDAYSANDLHAFGVARFERLDTADDAAADAARVVQAWFGTPDQPRWPADILVAGGDLIDPDSLIRTSGPVRSDRDDQHYGLYREHCVTCHGIAGDGRGPAARFQSPYPRDLRRGVFKWKTTERNAKPVRDDFRRLLEHGVPGTAMPRFAGIDVADREALIDHLIYLSIRGEVERKLIESAIREIGYGDGEDVADADRLSVRPDTPGGQASIEILQRVVQSWVDADSRVVKLPSLVSETIATPETIALGRRVFNGQIAGCAGCHGVDGRGGMPTLDYDDAVKEYTTRAGIDPRDRVAFSQVKSLGALPARPSQPRVLTGGVFRGGVFRGGVDDQSLYCRITQGIAGTPMAAVAVGEGESRTALSVEEVTGLIHFLQSMDPHGKNLVTGKNVDAGKNLIAGKNLVTGKNVDAGKNLVAGKDGGTE